MIIFLCSLPVAFLFLKVRLPVTLGFLVTGALIGPEGLAWIQDREQVQVLAELGIALLLLFIGMEFSFDVFLKMKRASIQGGILQILMTILAGWAIGLLLGWGYAKSLLFGFILALSSTAVVLSTLAGQRSLESIPGRVSTAILILQDLAFIPLLVLIPWLKRSGEVPLWVEMGREGLEAVGLVLAVYLFAKYLAQPFFLHIARTRSREIFVIAVIALALGLSWITHRLGFSFALGAFLAGLVLGSTPFRLQALAEIQPFRFCFLSLFFVSIGMLLDFDVLRENFRLLLGLVVLLPLLKTLVTTGVLMTARLPLRVSLTTSIYLGQIGEFSFLVASNGEKLGLIEPAFFQLIIATAVLAMMLTPLMIKLAPRIAALAARVGPLRRLHSADESALMEESRELSDHVVICGFGPLGQTFGGILHAHDIPFVVLELNPDTIEKVKRKHRPAFFGDGASEELLFEAGLERAKLLAITVPDFLNAGAIIRQARRINPDIPIITRAKFRNEVEKLYAAGADVVISEELEGGFEMSRYCLLQLGLPAEEVAKILHKAREFGSADFF
ncbi:MAG: cation:proton antiporter [Deltaproteobacteria bacterium]|nr:cation:proton antiporter [Deltaproteobacteria bacterium]